MKGVREAGRLSCLGLGNPDADPGLPTGFENQLDVRVDVHFVFVRRRQFLFAKLEQGPFDSVIGIARPAGDRVDGLAADLDDARIGDFQRRQAIATQGIRRSGKNAS